MSIIGRGMVGRELESTASNSTISFRDICSILTGLLGLITLIWYANMTSLVNVVKAGV
jgi:hypothetical protein